MDHFESAVTATLQHEGGYVCDPLDPGGETKYGISKRAYPTTDIKNLSIEQAVAIYRRDYWDKPGLFRLRDKALAARVFDLGVNCGPATAIRLLQAASNLLQPHDKISADGVLGPVTAQAVNAYAHQGALLATLKYLAVARYLSLNQPRFIAGWLNRLEA